MKDIKSESGAAAADWSRPKGYVKSRAATTAKG